jgi:hypothetical protein
MSVIYPDFQEGIWFPVSDAVYEAEIIGNFGQGIIRPVTLPDLIDERFLRFEVTSQSARPTWRQGLIVFQTVDSFAGANDAIAQFAILLAKPQIIEFIDYPDGFRLQLNFYPWFRDVRVKIEKFVI